MKEVKEGPKKLSYVMKQKSRILRILNGISYNEGIMKEKLLGLIKKASALDVKGGSADVLKEIKELEKKLDDVTRKKSFFEKELKKIFKILNK